jgi:hypothetical protein
MVTPDRVFSHGVQGRLEVRSRKHCGHGEKGNAFSCWGTVCDDLFDLNSAKVACRQLGLTGGSSLGNTMPSGEGFILMDNLVCTGEERSLDKCRFNGWGKHNCSKNHSEDVGVQCDAPTNKSWKHALPEIRLVDIDHTFQTPARDVEPESSWDYLGEGQCETGTAVCDGEWIAPTLTFESRHTFATIRS